MKRVKLPPAGPVEMAESAKCDIQSLRWGHKWHAWTNFSHHLEYEDPSMDNVFKALEEVDDDR